MLYYYVKLLLILLDLTYLLFYLFYLKTYIHHRPWPIDDDCHHNCGNNV